MATTEIPPRPNRMPATASWLGRLGAQARALFPRTDHYYIKRFEEETNLRCYLLLDRSASMAFGTATLTKWDYSCFLSTCLAYLMLRQQDAVGLMLFGTKPGLFVPPRCRRTHLRQLMSVMVQNAPEGTTDVPARYLGRMRELSEFYRKGLTDVGIEYVPIDTREPYDTVLSAYLSRRARTRR